MYRVTVDGVELEVDFRYRGLPPVDPRPRQTVCSVASHGRELTWGVSVCSMSDQFCRATGRELGLKRAVADLPRHVRKAIWEGYWRATRGVCELS